MQCPRYFNVEDEEAETDESNVARAADWRASRALVASLV